MDGTTADEFILSRQLADVTGYDIALVDCPPSLGLLTLNALTAASRLVVVTEASFLALQGTAELLETLELVRTHYNHHARAFLSDESGRGPHPG